MCRVYLNSHMGNIAPALKKLLKGAQNAQKEPEYQVPRCRCRNVGGSQLSVESEIQHYASRLRSSVVIPEFCL